MIKEHDVFAVLRKAAPYGQHTATSLSLNTLTPMPVETQDELSSILW